MLIALRMALGASPGRVIGLVVREGVILAGIGLGLGLVGAYFVGRAMQSMLFGVRPLDVVAFLSVGFVLMTAALLACYLPARRAARMARRPANTQLRDASHGHPSQSPARHRGHRNMT